MSSSAFGFCCIFLSILPFRSVNFLCAGGTKSSNFFHKGNLEFKCGGDCAWWSAVRWAIIDKPSLWEGPMTQAALGAAACSERANGSASVFSASARLEWEQLLHTGV